MPDLTLMDEATRRRFDALCGKAKGRSGPGLTLTEIGLAGDLARELESEDPDPGRVEALAGRLGIEAQEVRGA